eukprot:366333-Chlamydomonas_euryale.AAC.7
MACGARVVGVEGSVWQTTALIAGEALTAVAARGSHDCCRVRLSRSRRWPCGSKRISTRQPQGPPVRDGHVGPR